ncbi:MAG: motility associated factor glycosyltransferase family protein [Spirochaetales bacterium]|nr:motility associated factor glycosyltransferase family protein [Spirochaetales bacterium]
MGNTVFERNMLSLSTCNPKLSAKVGNAEENNSIIFNESRDGIKVPSLKSGGGIKHFHSIINPLKEGEKYYSLYSGHGYYIFLGMGACHHIYPFLEDNSITNILVIDKDMGTFKSILKNIDLCRIIIDPRVHFLIDETPEAVSNYIKNNYMPILDGDLKTINLGSRFNLFPQYFESVLASIKMTLAKVADDFSAQYVFGKTWFKNMLFNLSHAGKSELSFNTVRPVENIIITGAGPSLESEMDNLLKIRKDSFLIASDTSFPTLLKSGIKPDLILSIDCQQVSYHHFINGVPNDIPVLTDLSSPHILKNLTGNVSYFASGHPFSQYIVNRFRRFIQLDTSGGNVSHAALSLALKLSPENLYLFGIDFAYSKGKPYARGTYLYPYFLSRQKRFSTEEGSFFSMLFSSGNIIKQPEEGRFTYDTPLLSRYASHFSALLSKSGVKAVSYSRLKPAGISTAEKQKTKGSTLDLMNPDPAAVSSKDFLKQYARDLLGLPEPCLPLKRYFSQLNFEEKDLWVTLFPLAASIARTSTDEIKRQGNILLERTRKCAVEWIEKIVNRIGSLNIL